MTFFLAQILLAMPLVAAFALFALGIVLIYRASHVLNLAHGAMAMVPAYATYLTHQWGFPLPVALVAGVATGMGLGAAVETVFVRRLRPAGPTAQTVGTVAVLGLSIALVARFAGSGSVIAPSVFGDGRIEFANSGISYGQIGLIVVSVALTAALFLLFKVTPLGLAMRGSASNRTAAALMGVDPDRTTRIAWMLGGGLAAVAGILMAPVTALDPFVFPLQALPAFVAALIGGLGSMPGALVGSAVVGLTFGVVPGLTETPLIGEFARSSGASQIVLALVAFAVMARRGERLTAASTT